MLYSSTFQTSYIATHHKKHTFYYNIKEKIHNKLVIHGNAKLL